MKNRRLLGAIVGDILLSIFRTVDNINEESLITNKSKITGYTVLTLGIAKYIMEYHHLYKEAKEPGSSAKRKALLAKSVSDLAEKYPDLEYPVWFQRWTTNGNTIANDSIIPTCLSPLAIYFCNKANLDSTIRIIAKATHIFVTDKDTIIGSMALSTAIYSIQQYVRDSGNAQVLADFLEFFFKINIPDGFGELTSKYRNEWNTSAINALGPSIRVFLNNYHIDDAIDEIDSIDGRRTLVTPYTMTLMQAFNCFWGQCDNIESYRLLLPKDLLEINDKFYDFMSQYDSGYIEYNDLEIEDEVNECENNENISEEGSGWLDFSDIIKRLLKRL